MKRVFAPLSLAACIVLVCLFAACERKTEAPPPPPPTVIVAQPVEKQVTDYLEFTGQTDALEFVKIRARLEGWLDSIKFTPGARVEKDQLLFVIDPRPYQAEVDQKKALLMGKKADLNLAQTNLKRARQLLDTASISQLQFDETKAKELVAEAQVGIAKADLEKAQLNLAYTQVKSPINGRVSRNYVDQGNLVGATEKTLLTEVVNDEKVYVYFDVSEREYLRLRRLYPDKRQDPEAAGEVIPVFLQLADEKDFPHKGRLDFSEPRVDPSTGTLQGRAIFSNDSGLLLGGLFGRVRIPYRKDKALLVPEEAVGITQGGRYVLVVNKENVVEQRMVETGRLEGRMQAIREGLKKGDRIIVKGLQRARPGTKVQPETSSEAPKPSARSGAKTDPEESAGVDKSEKKKPEANRGGDATSKDPDDKKPKDDAPKKESPKN